MPFIITLRLCTGGKRWGVTPLWVQVGNETSNGIGIFYWEPQARPGWSGYTMGAMDNDDKATAVWDAFK